MDLNTLFHKIKNQEPQTIAVAHATDPTVFESAEKALEKNLASFIFTGPESEMEKALNEASFTFRDDTRVSFVNTDSDKESALTAVEIVKQDKARVLMKGMVSTSILLKAVLNKENGLRTGKILSHLAGFSLPGRDRLLFITDAAMNITPDLKEKVQIIDNAVYAVNKMGVDKPKVAVIAAVETVNPAMQATVDGAALTQMNRRNQIKGCEVDGPLGFDNAVSRTASSQKGITSEVAGNADILLVPGIETGNVLYKSLTYFGQAVVGGMIVGAKAPIVLTSRSDSADSKLFSMAMALSTTK
ncbi:bifunctional enoyl-CoA hydratase/phosphate acetyltransferase [Salipaludibacillus aurantiacus]|uniref:Phosphate butyryltransferase n=1 Tax=Salipaludibacillus aurantiacus TaxID=1601833 RepID=A0A1H9PK15_9BACI|nr:bifunctional enoyl-CoA hydratase/phosphate acetyltransferase [Salipaludibacillus aurantiacus]SER48581.1 phosphate butyryltransferase [Salipaludibacillus aurantiacus]